MALIASISGIRGTVGSGPDNLNPETVLGFTAAFGQKIINSKPVGPWRVVIGRDARVSGPALSQAAAAVLQALGFQVIDIGLASTPTVELAVVGEAADGGIMVSASHNPAEWNALKLLDGHGEFFSDQEGRQILELVSKRPVPFAPSTGYGSYQTVTGWTKRHIDQILRLPAVNVAAIRKAGFKVAVDAVNSVGGLAVPELLKALGVDDVFLVNCEPDGRFAHNPEPLSENLSGLATAVVSNKADLGIAVDPDVDRLAFVCEDGSFFGEEYTLVAVADYILAKHADDSFALATVSNLSSTRALKNVSDYYEAAYFAAPVGEVNVVTEMKRVRALIGGEGNGGVIYPKLHYGRDALVGIALFLSHLAESASTCSELRGRYPSYFLSKNKIEYPEKFDINPALAAVKAAFPQALVDERDGLKLDLADSWLQLRRSNTEPIIRVYSEAGRQEAADALAQKALQIIKDLF